MLGGAAKARREAEAGMDIGAEQLRESLDALALIEPAFAPAIGRIGYPPPRIRDRGFETMLRAIVGQQVSIKAAAAILARVEAATGGIDDPAKIAATSDDDLRAAGLSRQKILYVKSLADEVLSGRLDFHALPEDDEEGRRSVVTQLFGQGGESVWLQPPFFCDYGSNIFLGQRVFFNFNCVVLDVCEVRIGDYTLFGPAVQIYTAMHPLDPMLRRSQEFGKPVTIGSDVWVGGAAIVCPGVTVGSRTVIGAGSVVTRDLPEGVAAAAGRLTMSPSILRLPVATTTHPLRAAGRHSRRKMIFRFRNCRPEQAQCSSGMANGSQ